MGEDLAIAKAEREVAMSAAVDSARSGATTVVLIESSDGSAWRMLERASEAQMSMARAVGTVAGRSHVGCVAEELHLDELEIDAVAVEDAQWADPTSIGRLQRLIKEDSGRLFIIAHRPLSEGDGWGLGRLAEVARENAVLYELVGEAMDGSRQGAPSDPAGVDLVVAAGLSSESISVPVVARILDLPESQALALAEKLVEEGFLRQTRSGFARSTGGAGVDVGEARIGYVAGRLATATEATGGPSDVVGNLRLAAGDAAGAYPLLVSATLDAQRRRALGEAFHLAESALTAAESGEVGEASELGEMHLVCARFLRAAGRSELAAAHLDKAIPRLEGAARIDALGFAAAVADDRQHPQEAERILAIAEWEATRQGETGKLGSLSSFHARALHRIGFTAEADAIVEKAFAILEGNSTQAQRFNASVNRAWIFFDRGEVAWAEMEFTHLRDAAATVEGDASVADKEAWRARALFASGRPSEALAAVGVAEELAERTEVEAPLFLAELALTEGTLAYGRYHEALAAADRVQDLVERQLPAWENVARSNKALALLRLGRIDEARSEIEAALDATPAGANGWRLRTRCRAIQLEIAAAAGGRWEQREAEDLADLMLQSHLYGWAAELMCVMAERGKHKEVAREAMALAMQIGNPMLAARAAGAGRLWADPSAAPVIRAVKGIETRLPEGWDDEWRALSHIAGAMEAPEPSAGEDDHLDTAALDRALRKAGLAGADVILSPAQRRRHGLVTRRSTIRPLRWMAAAVGVIVLAGATSVAVAQLRPDPAPSTVIREVAITAPPQELALEETEIPVPEGVELVGTAEHRGGSGRSGVVESQGIRSVGGHFWVYETEGPIEAAPVAYGRWVLVGSTNGTFSALNMTDGSVLWTMDTGGVSATPAVAVAQLGEGSNEAMVVVGDDDGLVQARPIARDALATVQWRASLGAGILSAPVIADGLVMVGASDGFVHALDLLNGDPKWKYPAEGEPIARISADLAYADGVLYVGAEDGVLYLIEAATGELICSKDFGAPIVTHPIVVDGVVYVPTEGNQIHVRPAGACEGGVPNRLPVYVTETPVRVAPVIVGDEMYLPSGVFLYKIDLTNYDHLWPASTVTASRPVTSTLVAGDTVIVGSEDGVVRAVDAASGEALWEWRTGQFVRGAPAVVEGAVFIASADGNVYAVGP